MEIFRWVVLGLLALVAVFFFLYPIYLAGDLSAKKTPGDMPQILLWATTIIGGALATNFGAVFGLAFSPDTSFWFFGSQEPQEPSVSATEILQAFACVIYLIGLFSALYLWWKKASWSQNPDDTVLLLPDLTKTLIGIALGALMVVLSVSGGS